jgi:hypothetical protein
MSIISWVVVGLIAGLLARRLVIPGDGSRGADRHHRRGDGRGGGWWRPYRPPRRRRGPRPERVVGPGGHAGGDRPSLRLPAGRRPRRSLYVNLTGVTPLRSQRTAGAALPMLEMRRLVGCAFLVWPDELTTLAATKSGYGLRCLLASSRRYSASSTPISSP